MNVFGHWNANFEGGRFGSVQIGLEQKDGMLKGIATLNEPKLGYYQYTVTGDLSDDISLQLKPAEPNHARSLGLGAVAVKGKLVECNTIKGVCRSTNGYSGNFTAKRYADPSEHLSENSLKNVFVSYSHSDRSFLDALLVHGKPLERSGQIDVWADTKIKAGARWKEEVESALSVGTKSGCCIFDTLEAQKGSKVLQKNGGKSQEKLKGSMEKSGGFGGQASMSYRVLLSEEAWEFVDRENLDRQMLIRQLRQLPESGDFNETNPIDLRELSITIAGDLAVTYFFRPSRFRN